MIETAPPVPTPVVVTPVTVTLSAETAVIVMSPELVLFKKIPPVAVVAARSDKPSVSILAVLLPMPLPALRSKSPVPMTILPVPSTI